MSSVAGMARRMRSAMGRLRASDLIRQWRYGQVRALVERIRREGYTEWRAAAEADVRRAARSLRGDRTGWNSGIVSGKLRSLEDLRIELEELRADRAAAARLAPGAADVLARLHGDLLKFEEIMREGGAVGHPPASSEDEEFESFDEVEEE